MASNYFNADQVLEMVLRVGSDLEDEESVEQDFDDQESESDCASFSFLSLERFAEGLVQTLLSYDRPSLLEDEVRAKNSVFIFFHFLNKV